MFESIDELKDIQHQGIVIETINILTLLKDQIRPVDSYKFKELLESCESDAIQYALRDLEKCHEALK